MTNSTKYHNTLSQYFASKDYFLEPIEQQRERVKRLPPTPRPVNIRKVMELPWQRLTIAKSMNQWNEIIKLFTDLFFLEAKVEARFIYELVRDFQLVEEDYGAPGAVLLNILPFAGFIKRKAALFSLRPCLVFQEAANQPASSPVSVAAHGWQPANVLRRRWIDWVNREFTRAKPDFEIGSGITWTGRLPLLTSPDDRKAWMIDRDGRLIEVEVVTGQTHIVWDTICPCCQSLLVLGWQDGPRLVLLGITGDWIVGNVLNSRPDFCTILDLNDGRIAACQPCTEGALLVVTYPSHEPARLMLVGIDSDGRPMRGTTVQLDFGWKPRTGLSVLRSQGLASCPYGPRMRDCALIDYRRGTILMRYTGHKTFIEACCAVEAKDLLVSGAQDGEILFFRLSTGELIARIEPPWRQVKSIVWSPRHGCLIAAGTGNAHEETCLAWNLGKDGPPKVSTFPSHEFNFFVLSAEEQLVFSGPLPLGPFGGIPDSHSDHDAVIVRQVADLMPTDGEVPWDEPEQLHHNSVVLEIHLLPGRERVVTTSLFGEIWIWELTSGRPLVRSHPEAIDVIYGSVVSKDGQWMAVASMNSSVEWEDGRPKVTDSRRVVTLWNLAGDLVDPVWKSEGATGSICPSGHDELIHDAFGYFGRIVLEGGIGPYEAISPDHNRVFSAGDSGLYVYEAAPLQEVAWFEVPTRVTVVCAVDKDCALVGDAMGYVWILRLRNTANGMESGVAFGPKKNPWWKFSG